MASKIKASAFIDECRKYVGFGYVYGAVGVECTVELLRTKERQYGAKMGPGYYQRGGDFTKGKCARWLGVFVADCSGLLKYVRRKLTGVWRDVSAQGTYDQCPVSKRGKMDARKIEPGYFVFMYSSSARRITHVGVYVGDGWVIEARGVDHGIVKTRLAGRKWTHMGLADYMELDTYDDVVQPPNDPNPEDDSGDASTPKPDDLPVLRFGSRHAKVLLAQELLVDHGFALPKSTKNGKLNGYFYIEVLNRVKAFQRTHRDVYGRPLEVDGVIGVLTWGAMLRPPTELA